MYRVKEYVCPQTVEECAQLLQENKRGRLIGGNLFLRMTSIEIPLAIDLSGCGLDYIVQDESGQIRLGAMCSLRALEASPILQDYAGGTNIIYFLFVAFIGVNFLVEFAVNAVLSAAIARIVQAVQKHLAK